MRRTIEVARAEGLKRVVSTMSPENKDMLAIAQRLGFRITKAGPYMRAEMEL